MGYPLPMEPGITVPSAGTTGAAVCGTEGVVGCTMAQPLDPLEAQPLLQEEQPLEPWLL